MAKTMRISGKGQPAARALHLLGRAASCSGTGDSARGLASGLIGWWLPQSLACCGSTRSLAAKIPLASGRGDVPQAGHLCVACSLASSAPHTNSFNTCASLSSCRGTFCGRYPTVWLR